MSLAGSVITNWLRWTDLCYILKVNYYTTYKRTKVDSGPCFLESFSFLKYCNKYNHTELENLRNWKPRSSFYLLIKSTGQVVSVVCVQFEECNDTSNIQISSSEGT